MRTRTWTALALLATACAPTGEAADAPLTLEHERFVLDNGLEVILHEDHSDPMAAVAMTFHVGSAREVAGRTGFAHMFEHLFFLDSENLGPGGLDRLMTRIGSSTNGSTNRDRTNYFEVVPIDGLEKALWAEADKLGFFINTVTESVVAKEKQVVKNEKRQGVDNQPYGHTNFVISHALYPDGHPYQWQVIGSLADLDAATLADAQEFHRLWYGPNNATLVVAGAIDPEQTRAWVEKYFGEIPRRDTPERPEPPPVELAESALLVHEDNYARLPQLTVAWPAVPVYHPDAYALDALAALLTDGKSTPFHRVIVEDRKLAPDVIAFHFPQELAGRFTLRIRAFADTDLDDVQSAIDEAFARFESEGVRPEELRRVKAGTETAFYQGISSTLGKAFSLAQYAIFADDPGFVTEDLERTLSVTAEDVMRVYEAYIKDRPYVAASFVPQGQAQLALEGSTRAAVVTEPIVQGAEGEFAVTRGDARTPGGSFDRSVEPPYGPTPTLHAPDVWMEELANGLSVYGIEDRETPLVQFELSFRGGMLLDEPGRIGVANLLAETMLEGTASRTPEELEQAIDLLGSDINVNSGTQSFVISGRTLARNYAETLALVQEILLEPRWDPERFDLARQRVVNQVRQRQANPNAIATTAFARRLYGDHVLAEEANGSLSTLEALTVDDLRGYHARALVPALASFHVAGAVDADEATAALSGLAAGWSPAEPPAFPDDPEWDPDRAGVFFVDVPDASQSVLRIGRLALAENHPDYHAATVMNFRLGGGGFASDLTQQLREGKGYTYGIGSGFSGTDLLGPFAIQSGVRSNVTLESLQLIKDILEAHGPEFDEEDLEATKGFLLRTNARAFETLGAKLGVLRDMSAYGFEADYLLDRQEVTRAMTIPQIQDLAARWLDPEGLVWLVVGDARTQRDRLRALGLGEAVLLDRDGRPRPAA